jgi:hypothetical protein
MHGSFQQTDFFIYAAADTKYFDFYGRALVNSVLQNTPYGIHLHLYDPTDKQLEFCSRPRVTVTWETLLPNQFDQAIKFWSRWDLSEPWASRKHKMLGLKQYSDNRDLEIWIRKTYFACMRFVRLGEFLKQPQRLLEIDIDGIVRKPFVVEFNNDADIDVYLYEKIKIDKVTRQAKLTGHLAGSILFTPKPQALEFIQDLATVIRGELESDNVYWFLDQNSLDLVISKYRKGLLPMSMIDWKMDINSAIWTAKGQRKELDIFQCELARYL